MRPSVLAFEFEPIVALGLLVAVASGAPACGAHAAGAAVEPVETPACTAGEHAEDGVGCVRAGVPPSLCGAGFTDDGASGCAPLFPAAPCADWTMAIPGDTACRDVSPCADGTWGDAPIDATTEFVDASFVGTSDGSRDRPWTHVADAVAAAADGALVAIAAGRYAESVDVTGRAVRLWGRCPRLVALQPPPPVDVEATTWALHVTETTARVHGIAIVGAWSAIRLGAAAGVTIDHAVVRDDQYVVTRDGLGRGELTLEDSLVDGAGSVIDAADVDVTVVRSELRAFAAMYGTPIAISGHADGGPHVQIAASAFEDVRDDVVAVRNASLDVDGVFVRMVTSPNATCVAVSGTSTVTLTRSRLEGGAHAIVADHEASDASTWPDVTISATTIRTSFLPERLANVGITAAVVQRGGHLRASALSLDVVQRTGAILAVGADVAVDALLARAGASDVTPSLAVAAVGGVIAMSDVLGDEGSTLAIRGSVLDGFSGAGIVVAGGSATLDATAVRATSALGGSFGDALSVIVQEGAATSVDVRGCDLSGSARAGLSSFGASVTVGATRFDDDAIDLDGETLGGVNAAFDDRGGNACATAGAAHPCAVASAALAPPLPTP